MFLQFKVTAELPEKLTAFQNGFFWGVGAGGGWEKPVQPLSKYWYPWYNPGAK